MTLVQADSGTPRVSVVVPVYNAERYIGETLASIAAQDFGGFDVHVVDDCSTDASPDIIRAFCEGDPRFVYHRVPANFGGPAGPRNLGITASTGEYVAFCDADDVWVTHKLSVQLAVADRTGADVISAVIRDFTDGDPFPEFERPSGKVPLTTISHRRLLVKNWIALSSVLVRRSALVAVGPFNTAKSHVAVEDFDMWLRITQKGDRVVRVGVPLVHYRKLPTSISARKSMMVRKAVNVIGEDYGRRGLGTIFSVVRPLHQVAYVVSSAWMRAVKREL
jgi:teichuronic acid biosynthesis glycosyltransferase TuaG